MPSQDPVSPVQLSLVTVDPCDIHLELVDDQISIHSSSGLPTNKAQTYTLDPPHHDSRSGASYWDSGGVELEPSLDSGIFIPPALLKDEWSLKDSKKVGARFSHRDDATSPHHCALTGLKCLEDILPLH